MVTRQQAMYAASDVKDEISSYFRSLGFTVTWDFSRRTGLHWYEINDGNDELVQIDFGVSLDVLKADLPRLAAGLPALCEGPDWQVRGTRENLERVVDRMAR